MKKAYTYSLIAVVLVYTIGWFFAAHKIEKEVYSALDALKTSRTIKKYSTDVSVSGYPFSFNVKFKSPSFTASDDGYNINTVFNGDINAKAGLLSRYFVVTTSGDANFKGNIGSYNFDVVSEGDRTSTYKVKFSGLPISPFFINKVMSVLKAEKPEYQKLFSGANIDIRAFTTHDKIHEKTLIDATRINLGADFDISGDDIEVSGVEFVDRVKFFEESRNLWQHIQRLPMVRQVQKSLGPDIMNYFNVFALQQYLV